MFSTHGAGVSIDSARVASVQDLTLSFARDGAFAQRAVSVHAAVIAGWTGRDKVALEKHIVELEALGVARPASTPIFYRVAAARLTVADTIEAVGGASSGEVEYLLLQHAGRTWVGVGSDHTDREVETYGITVSKQLCDKPIAPQFWPLDEVAPHWDRLVTRAWIHVGGTRSLYQEGALGAMLAPADLIAGYTGAAKMAEATLMFCGTHAAHGGIRPAERFEFELEDPVLGRCIRHGYDVAVLPIAG